MNLCLLTVTLLFAATGADASSVTNTALVPCAKLEHDSYDWFARHERILREQRAMDPEVVFVGDSITHFWAGRDTIGGADANERWKKTFGAFRTLNLGYGWDRIQNVLWRLDHGEMDGVKPRRIVLHIGTNNIGGTKNARANSPEEIAEGTLAIIRRLHEKAPDAQIVVMAIFPREEKADGLWRRVSAASNALVARQVAALPYVTYLDIGPRFLAADGTLPKTMMFDFCHPTTAGYDVWAKAILPLLARSADEIAPESGHLDHFSDGILSIIHFGPNTFCDKEWGYGDTPPAAFDPSRLDTDQWVDAMVAGGIRRVIMVAKHHDGFNLWPSRLNAGYSVAASPWQGGKGDVLRSVQESCRRRGVRFGVYLSPWDRHQANFAQAGYPAYYQAQWDDIFAHYGPVCEIWLDGACGGDGWYGGAKERRRIDGSPWAYYGMPKLLEKMHRHNPRAIAFGGCGAHSAVWVGNERGVAPESVWYVTPRGHWETPECDAPLRGGWFWHPHDRPKSLYTLVEMYFSSVGHGCVLNLGIAPNREGRVGDDDVARLKEFGDYVRRFNAVDLAADAQVTRAEGEVALRLPAAKKVNCLDASEILDAGQRIQSWRFEAKVADAWRQLAEGTSFGYRRFARFETTEASEFRLRFTGSRPGAAIGKVSLRWAEAVARRPDERIAATALRGKGFYYTWDESAPANELVYVFPRPTKVGAFEFDPKRNAGSLVDKWTLYSSADGRTWTKLQEGEFGNIRANPVRQHVSLERPGVFRYLRLVAEHAVESVPRWHRANEDCVKLFDRP